MCQFKYLGGVSSEVGFEIMYGSHYDGLMYVLCLDCFGGIRSCSVYDRSCCLSFHDTLC